MDTPEEQALFHSIADKLTTENDSTSLGRMMSSPGIKYKDKVFAFYHNKEMVFRLGKEFDPQSHDIQSYSLLNPFKNKPPMAGWFQIPFTENRLWEMLARRALNHMSGEQGSN